LYDIIARKFGLLNYQPFESADYTKKISVNRNIITNLGDAGKLYSPTSHSVDNIYFKW